MILPKFGIIGIPPPPTDFVGSPPETFSGVPAPYLNEGGREGSGPLACVVDKYDRVILAEDRVSQGAIAEARPGHVLPRRVLELNKAALETGAEGAVLARVGDGLEPHLDLAPVAGLKTRFLGLAVEQFYGLCGFLKIFMY